MKLLFDHNLSPALVTRLADVFPSSQHVYKIDLDTADDVVICEYASKNSFVIVTKDADYRDILTFRPSPPSVLWVRLGNCSTDDVERIIREQADQIIAFAQHESARLLILL